MLLWKFQLVFLLLNTWYSLCVFISIFFFSLFPYFTFFWFSCMILFTDCAVLWLFTVHSVSSTFSTSFTYWRSGAFFSLVLKSLAVVTSGWVWDECFDFSYSISDFYWRKVFCWSWEYMYSFGLFCNFLDGDSSGVSNTMFVKVVFLFHPGCRGSGLDFSLCPLISLGSYKDRFLL